MYYFNLQIKDTSIIIFLDQMCLLFSDNAVLMVFVTYLTESVIKRYIICSSICYCAHFKEGRKYLILRQGICDVSIFRNCSFRQNISISSTKGIFDPNISVFATTEQLYV